MDQYLARKKLLIFSLASFVMSACVSGALYGFAAMSIMDKEVWHFKIFTIRHEEEWTTHETRTETYTTGSGKHQTTHTKTVHYTENHGPYWTAIDERSSEHRIDSSEYDKWSKVWGNQLQTGVHKGSSAGWDRSITGKIFECKWTRDFERIYPWDEIHHYKNKVRHCSSVLKYREPTKELEKLYPRPAESGDCSPVLCYGASLGAADIQRLRQVNAELGPKYLVHTLLVLFGKDADRSKIDDILSAWRSVNKNELVTFLALDGGSTVRWCEVQSWMDDTTIHATLRDALVAEPFTARRYSDLLMQYVPKQWKKKNFHDFDYLRVEIPIGWKVIAILVVIGGLVGIFVVVDQKVTLSW